jgi:hypothetical protein
LETVLRELLEELSIEFKRKRSKIGINKDNIGHFLALNKKNFLQCHVDSKTNTNDRLRLIGLFFVHVNEKKFIFTLKNKKENQVFMNRFSQLEKQTKILKRLFSFCFRHGNG